MSTFCGTYEVSSGYVSQRGESLTKIPKSVVEIFNLGHGLYRFAQLVENEDKYLGSGFEYGDKLLFVVESHTLVPIFEEVIVERRGPGKILIKKVSKERVSAVLLKGRKVC